MKNKKMNLLAGLIASVGLMGGLQANAADTGWYGSVSLGTSTVDTGVSNTTGTASLDEDDTSFKITFGQKLDKVLSIEGFYADFGEASLTGNTGDTFDSGGTTWVFTADNAKVATSASGLGINAKFTHAFTDKSSIAGRLGLLMWDVTTSASTATTASSASDDGIDLFYGIGYKYDFNKQYSLTVDYDMYTADTFDFNTLAVGVSFNF